VIDIREKVKDKVTGVALELKGYGRKEANGREGLNLVEEDGDWEDEVNLSRVLERRQDAS
jgi:hypothetical protein